MSAISNRGFVFEDGDPSVGIFGSAWMHEDCPASVPYLDGPGLEVEERQIAVVRRDGWTVRSWWLITCLDCAQQTLVYDDDLSPTDEIADAMARDEEEAMRLDAMADAMTAQYDDDPNPYHGDYSEC